MLDMCAWLFSTMAIEYTRGRAGRLFDGLSRVWWDVGGEVYESSLAEVSCDFATRMECSVF